MDGNMVFYLYHKTIKQLIAVIIHHRSANDTLAPWLYTYNFLNGELVRMSKWNGMGGKYKKRIIAEYYLQDEKVFYREENGTILYNINAAIEESKQLVGRAPIYK